jgi:23S rRNA A2030 N6-methylase RlmJ
MHTMHLIKLILVDDCKVNALSILKEVLWGKKKVDYANDYHSVTLSYILQSNYSQESREVIEEIIKIIIDSKPSPSDLQFVDEIKAIFNQDYSFESEYDSLV